MIGCEEKPDLTVLVPTYNHQPYLPEALKSLEDQSIFEKIRVLISDDGSSDSTLEISEDFASRHTNVSVRRNAKNLGVMEHYREVVPLVESEFTSILEGDDFLTDTTKLSRHVEFLKRFSEVNSVFSGYSLLYDTGRIKKRDSLFLPGRSYFLSFEDLLQDNYSASFTNCSYRTESLKQALRNDVSRRGYDWLVNMLIASVSSMGFIPGSMSTYRVHSNGQWNKQSSFEKTRLTLRTLEALTEEVSPRLQKTVVAEIARLARIESEKYQ